jgi:1-acyl-sn-glycerol-3-phosphate acyltransferase
MERCTVIAKKEVFYLWPFGLACWLWGTIFIDRVKVEKAQNTINSAEDVIRNNKVYRRADKSLARPTSRCILFDGENILFDTSLVIYINSTNFPPIMIINRIYEYQNLLSL